MIFIEFFGFSRYFPYMSIISPYIVHIFPCIFHIFHIFSIIFHICPCIFHICPYIVHILFNIFSIGFSIYFPYFSPGFLEVSGHHPRCRGKVKASVRCLRLEVESLAESAEGKDQDEPKRARPLKLKS